MDTTSKWLIAAIIFFTSCLIASRLERNNKVASYYFEGMITKSGEMFDRNAYTAAVPTEEEMYHWYKVEWKGRVVYVYANDLMGKQNYRTSDKRHIDLSEAAFGRLAPLEAGVLKGVSITKVN